MFDYRQYKRGYFMPPVECNDWVKKEYIDKAPVWCSVDLRDGNQALVEPMSLDEKLEFFNKLIKVGFKEIEIGFPAASETEYELCRTLIEKNMIPDDVTIQVLTQARPHIIKKTFEAVKGAPRAIVHVYNSTSLAQREQVFRKSKEEIKQIAIEGAKLLKELAEADGGNFLFEYSPESFTGTEPEYALEVCNAVIDENILVHNLEILKYVEDKTGCKILLAQKAFSAFYEYPLIGRYISGTTASGLYEARLGREEMNKENHVYAPAYKEKDIDELVKICDHIIFNSIGQLMRYKEKCIRSGISIGLRINPEISTQGDNAIYDPCAYGSRLGVTIDMLNKADEEVLNGVEGLHFHTLCEQNSDALAITLKAVEDKFGHIMKNMKWINMGGGHHITRKDYDIDTLIGCVNHIKSEYNVQVYLEPGEAVALNAGYLVTEVLDKVDNGIETLILDASAACHMPDVLEMPYTPPLRGAQIIKNIKEYKDVTAGKDIQENEDIRKHKDKKEYRENVYRLSSYTCLAGDIIGDYKFDSKINIGDRLVFEDMAIYSMVKNNTFNGIPLPAIAVMKDKEVRIIKEFGYEDFKWRLS